MSKWNPKNLQEEALKYDRRTDFRRGSGGAAKIAYQLGIMDEICSHMKPKFSIKWNPESIKQEALKYQGRRQFKLNSGGAYKAALKLGIIDEVCEHMESMYWTKEKIIAVANKYKSLKKFMKEKKGAYLNAMRNGYLEEVTKHMERLQLPHGYWNKERCKEVAIQYEYRNEFQENCGSGYNACLNNGWLDEVCSHMKVSAHGYYHCVYVISNKRKNLAYIGITRQLFNARMDAHRNKDNNSNSRKISRLKDTKFIQLTDYLYKGDEVKDIETKTVEDYRNKGFKILNHMDRLGGTGTEKRIYTDEIIFKEAKKYKTRVEFKTKSPRIYDAAVKQRLLDQTCSHMRGIAKKNFWTIEECIKFAKTCRDQDEFSRGQNGAYSAARKNGWLEEIYKNLRAKNDMSWLRPSTRKDVWCFADQYFDIWVENEKCGRDKMKSLTNLNLDKMIKKFRRGWIPSKDIEWREWAEKIKSNLKMA